MRRTTTTLGSESLAPVRAPEWLLIVALDRERLAAEPLRIELGGLVEVELGRADTRAVLRSGTRLRIDVATSGVSHVHARMTAEGDGWVIADAGSKNGTYVNSRHIERSVLGDGDVIECAGTFLVIRRARGRARDHNAADDRRAVLRTFSPQLERELAVLPKIASSSLPILVRGDSGTGKEVAAHAIHTLSGRPGAMIAVNCGALPATLIESELFGSRRGAFSGAEDRPGLVRNAEHGTLFLDEVAELPMPSQVALLRLLQSGEVQPLGAGKPVTVDVRIVAATHRPVEELVKSHQFRRDLYSRLRAHELRLPALRDRLEDLGLLIAALLARIEPGGPPRRLSRAAARALFRHSWPFHIRELEQMLRSAVARADGAEIGVADLRLADTEPGDGGGDSTGCDALTDALRRHGGNTSAVARELETSRTQVQRLLKKYGLVAATFRRR